MTSLLTNCLCCAGNCLCHAFNNICSDAMKINPKLFSRVGYIVLSLFSVLFSLLVLFYGSVILKPFNGFIGCPDSNADNYDKCLGISSVYRMSLTLVAMHVIVILFSFCGGKCAKILNNDCWTFKILIVFGGYFAFFFVGNGFFTVYAQISRYVSLIFILYQVLVTISFAHVININLVDGLDNAEEKGRGACKYQFCLMFLTAIFFGLSVFWIIISFINHYARWYNFIIIGITIFLGVAFTILSISNIVNRKRLLTSIYMLSFTTYLCWSALESQPKVTTKSSDSATVRILEEVPMISLNFLDISIGIVYLFISLCFLGFYIKKNPSTRSNIGESESEKVLDSNPLIEHEDVPADATLLEKNLKLEDNEEEITAAYIYFQVFMIFMSVYYCMLLTNWNVVDADSKSILPNESWTSFWIKLITLILSNLMYIFVLIAPRIFPDREFIF